MEENKNKREEKRTAIQDITDYADAVIVAIVVSVVILSTILVSGFVSGGSMLETLSDKDRYIVWSLFYEPKIGDIVIFQPEVKDIPSEEKIWVKRIIADEYQTVDVRDGKVYVDGVEKYEPYLTQRTFQLMFSQISFPYTVPEGCVFVMGDNRGNSTDSRMIGAVNKNRIIGKLLFRYFSPAGNKLGVVD